MSSGAQETDVVYGPVVDAIEEELSGFFSRVLSAAALRDVSTKTAERLIKLGAIPTQPDCEHGNPERTVKCENPAVWGSSYCLEHS